MTETPTSPLAVQVGGTHYKNMRIQPVEFIHANGLGFIEGAVVKYVSRWRSKGGIADLEKARHFIELLIELEKKVAPPPASAPVDWDAIRGEFLKVFPGKPAQTSPEQLELFPEARS